jgi:hypothetical protein
LQVSPRCHILIFESERLGDRQFEPKLAEWFTSFCTEVQHDTIPCRLYLCRIQKSLDEEINLTLEYEGEPLSHTMTDIRPVKYATFVPHSLFSPVELWPRRRQSDTTRDTNALSCSFHNLFRGIKLFFDYPKDYLEFMTLITYQLVLPDVRKVPSSSGAIISFKHCRLTEERTGFHRDKSHIFERGIVQVWKTLSATEYEARYEHGEETVDHGTTQESAPLQRGVPHPPHAQAPVYKLAIFGHEIGTKNTRTCVIVDGEYSTH